MAISDITSILLWWMYTFLIGMVFFPITRRLFPSWYDKGYIFAKIFGILLLTYIVFLFSFLQLFPFTRVVLFGVLFVVGICSLLENVSFSKKSPLLKNVTLAELRGHFKTFLVIECVFLIALFVLSYVRAFSPDIHGLEKYMDYGFMQSILRSESFPPKDMWLTPFSINYYYFGHFYAAVLMKLTGIPPSIGYNLVLATVFALTFTGAFSIGSNLYTFLIRTKVQFLKRFLAGLLTGLLVSVSGNLHMLYTFFTAYENESPVHFFAKKCLKEIQGKCATWGDPIIQFSPLSFPNNYWYPNATRFIHNTIHEFPMYSWIVADLHGHVLDMPFVLFTLAFLLSSFMKPKDKQHETPQRSFLHKLNIFHNDPISLTTALLMGLLMAVMYMTNAWDGLIYFLLSVFVYTLIVSRQRIKKESLTGIKSMYTAFVRGRVILATITASLITFSSFLLFSLPFSLSFKPFVSGVGVLCGAEIFGPILNPLFFTKEGDVITPIIPGKIGPFLFETNHCLRSPWWQLLILYGFFLFFILLFFFLLTKVKTRVTADYFIVILIILGIILITVPEFIYVKDIYPDHYRANTMFKLVFQAFIILSIVSAYTVMRFTEHIRILFQTRKGKLIAPFVLFLILGLLSLVLTYPYLGIKSYYGDLKTYVGLDGTTYLKNLYPTDYDAIQWINKSISGQPVILEAQGDSYTDYARVSANTGLPTILGWTVHEWLWRGSYDIKEGETLDPTKIYDVPAPRISEVQTLYETEDLKETARLLKKYNVSYIFIGNLEVQKYPQLKEEKFKRFGKIVYQKEATKIYKIH